MSYGHATFDFTNTNALIFGGTSGINFGIAQAFSAAGAQVGIVGRNTEKANSACEILNGAGANAFYYTADVRDMAAVKAVFEQFSKDAGVLHTLVSGAAGNFPATINEMSSNGFKAVVDIDLIGTFHVMRAAFPYLKKPGASVINISAPQSDIPMARQAHVCAAKAGVDMVTKTLCIEWGTEGVRINSVIPGPIDGTEGMARLTPTTEARNAVIEAVPLQRMGSPDEVAGACLFLASDAARYVTGTIIAADGGWLANGALLDLG